MKLLTVTLVAALSCVMPAVSVAGPVENRWTQIELTIDAAVRHVMETDDIPGMAVGVVVEGRTHIFNYGVASKQTGQPVTNDTLFELGSVSKTFTATLASWAQVDRQLSLSDTIATHLPALQGSAFGNVSLLALGTHTPGGLPLQVPDNILTEEQLMTYFKQWSPTYAPGSYRTYANPGIGILGLITAKTMGQDFKLLMERRLYPALGMTRSYIDVPQARMDDYAEGHAKDGTHIRMATGMLSDEAYGMKSTVSDMLRFVSANMGESVSNPELQRAIDATHTGYFQAGVMTQDLIWEQYPYPVTLQSLQAGNSTRMIFEPTPVTQFDPTLAPRSDVWINKTGSTDGFGAYVAFIPLKQIGIVILATKNFPITDRVSMAYAILTSLANAE